MKAQIASAVKELSLEGVANKISQTQVEVQKTLADLGTKLAERLQELRDVEAGIIFKQEELANLHQIEAESMNLDDLIATIKETRANWVKEQEQRKETWNTEFADHAAQIAREEDEYTYATNLQRNRDTEAHAEKIRQMVKQAEDKLSSATGALEQREAVVKSSEAEFARLKQVELTLPAEIKKSVEREIAIASNSIKREFEHKSTLEAKDSATKIQILEAQIASEKQRVSALAYDLVSAKSMLADAHKAAQDTAHKALEASAERGTINALQQALNQDKAKVNGRS